MVGRSAIEKNTEISRKHDMVRRADFAGIHANGNRDSRRTFGLFFVAQEVEDENFFTTVDLLPQRAG